MIFKSASFVAFVAILGASSAFAAPVGYARHDESKHVAMNRDVHSTPVHVPINRAVPLERRVTKELVGRQVESALERRANTARDHAPASPHTRRRKVVRGPSHRGRRGMGSTPPPPPPPPSGGNGNPGGDGKGKPPGPPKDKGGPNAPQNGNNSPLPPPPGPNPDDGGDGQDTPPLGGENPSSRPPPGFCPCAPGLSPPSDGSPTPSPLDGPPSPDNKPPSPPNGLPPPPEGSEDGEGSNGSGPGNDGGNDGPDGPGSPLDSPDGGPDGVPPPPPPPPSGSSNSNAPADCDTKPKGPPPPPNGQQGPPGMNGRPGPISHQGPSKPGMPMKPQHMGNQPNQRDESQIREIQIPSDWKRIPPKFLRRHVPSSELDAYFS